jgi:hypothetical protein
MKTSLSFRRVASAALALGIASVTASFAQTSTTPATATPPATTAPTCTAGERHHHHHHSVLTADEKAQLKKAKAAALAGSGTLQTEQAALKQQFETLRSQGSTATTDQWKALHQQASDFHAKLRSAELLVDPTLAPVFAKLDAHKHGHHSA